MSEKQWPIDAGNIGLGGNVLFTDGAEPPNYVVTWYDTETHDATAASTVVMVRGLGPFDDEGKRVFGRAGNADNLKVELRDTSGRPSNTVAIELDEDVRDSSTEDTLFFMHEAARRLLRQAGITPPVIETSDAPTAGRKFRMPRFLRRGR